MRTQLYAHNKTALEKVMKAFETSDRTCVVHPTGTGKSYLIAAVSENYQKVLILGPNIFVLDQVHDVLKWRKRGVEYMTYKTLMLTENPHTDYDLICLDEFHRAGAPKWGLAVDRLLELNKNAKILGTTATHIRYLDNERNMADELFNGNIASHITIAESWNQNILPIPRYVSGLFRWDKTANEITERIQRSRSLNAEEKRKRIFRLTNTRLHWELSYGMPAILRKHLDKHARRVIVFCGNIESLERMRQEVIGWFREAGFTLAGTCIMHSGLTESVQREQMRQFEDDKDSGVKLMFSVDMLNEGIHVPNVRALKDERLIIPMNMRDGSLFCVGKGNLDWLYSAPHGAGRLMSRKQCLDNLKMEDFEREMSNVYSTSVCRETIDESPMAYKPMQEIIDAIGDTVQVVDIIKPIYNFKAKTPEKPDWKANKHKLVKEG